MGGPHYKAAGQAACVHHTFTHAKVLAGILDRGLERYLPEKGDRKEKAYRPVEVPGNWKWYPELSTWTFRGKGLQATVTAYDWEYLPGGHVSGGTLSFLRHRRAGILLCASVGSYTRREPNNMQVPFMTRQECLALRIEAENRGEIYSSIYEDQAWIERGENTVSVGGQLKNIRHEPLGGSMYRFEYTFEESAVSVRAFFADGRLICPVISRSDEEIRVDGEQGNVEFGDPVRIRTEVRGEMSLPYGKERIFHLVPGFQALRIDVLPAEGEAEIRLRFEDS